MYGKIIQLNAIITANEEMIIFLQYCSSNIKTIIPKNNIDKICKELINLLATKLILNDVNKTIELYLQK